MKQATTLRTRLLVSFMAAALIPLIVATLVSVPLFRNNVYDMAGQSLETQATVANELLAEKVAQRANQADSLTRTIGDVRGKSITESTDILTRQAELVDFDYLLWIDAKGVLRGSSIGGTGQTVAWPELAEYIRTQEATSFTAIVPPVALSQLSLADDLKLIVKETEGGSATQSESEGALSIIAVAPVENASGGRIGTIVGVQTLKLQNDFVDSLAEKLGGVATVFQNGVRVATTVQTAEGERAIGTAVSDPVRAQTIDGAEPFRGEAFVVTKDYFTAYDPIVDPEGDVIGMMFVGLAQESYDRTVFSFTAGMLGLTVFGAIVAAIFAWTASTSLAKPIQRVSDAAQQVAGGDLTVNVPVAGFREAAAMGNAFNTMTMGLRQVLSRTGGSARKLDSVAREIADASSLEAENSSAQASAVTEATATIEELDRSFAAVADGARRVLEIAEDSLEVAENGREMVEGAAATTERLAEGAMGVREAASDLSVVAEDIGQVTFVIGSIAEQTKILALNAAIEAARAGEAGKGFGVVASEIRSLADSVSSSVSRIDQLVHGIQDSSKALADTAAQQAELGGDTVMAGMRTRNSLDAIYDRMTKTADAAREIANAASQQQNAAQQIVSVMHQISEGVSGNAASARQLADTAKEITNEAGGLSGSLQGFKVD